MYDLSSANNYIQNDFGVKLLNAIAASQGAKIVRKERQELSTKLMYKMIFFPTQRKSSSIIHKSTFFTVY